MEYTSTLQTLGKVGRGYRWLAGANSGASAIAQSLFTQAAILAMSLVTGVVTARALGVSGRGQLAAIMLWPTVFSGLFAFGLPSALNYHARRNRKTNGRSSSPP